MTAEVSPGSATITDEEVKLAPKYRVLIHNDDVTPAGYVVAVLAVYFRKDEEAAFKIMEEAHNTGVALVDVLGYEEAEFRIERVHADARTRKFPLTLTMEPES
jgi:ATP-dependent Clp protease adaptor protein ClpS